MSIQLKGGTALIDPGALLARAGIKQGDTIVEFGCGTSGHLVFPAAHLVGPTGNVYAVDILKSALAAIESRRKMEGADNVETIWADLERPSALSRISSSSVDIVVMLHILGQVKEQQHMLSETARILKPGGVLLICDWVLTAIPLGPPLAHRLDPAAAKQYAQAGGFVPKEEFNVGSYHWGMVLKKAA